jgi:FkbM family methyltransferase
MAKLGCAVARFDIEADCGDGSGDLSENLGRYGAGDFYRIAALPPQPRFCREAVEAAARAAEREQFDWLLLVGPEEQIAPDIFAKATPALRLHDALWGGAGLAKESLAPLRVEQVTRLVADDLASFLHAALAWWIGRSHFVRPALALDALTHAAGESWWAEYLLHIWLTGRAMKTAQALTAFDHAIPPIAPYDRERLVQYLDEKPVFVAVSHGAVTVSLPYTGRNPNIEREHMRGAFFERQELAFLADRLPKGLRVIDIGANTANHTIFFATVMNAGLVVPIEPEPRACRALRAAVRENALSNVDESLLGYGVGARLARMAAVSDERGGLGATRLVVHPRGTISVAPLDRLWHRPVDFIKIDVEGMEMAVLSGASRLLADYRPYLFIEVCDRRVGDFVAWADANRYRIERLFPDKTHCNFFLAPQERGR